MRQMARTLPDLTTAQMIVIWIRVRGKTWLKSYWEALLVASEILILLFMLAFDIL